MLSYEGRDPDDERPADYLETDQLRERYRNFEVM